MFKRFVAFIVLLIILIPIIYTFVLALTPDSLVILNKLGNRVTLQNFANVFKNTLIIRGIFVSIATSTIATLLRVTVVFLASYALMFTKVKGRKILFTFLLGTMFIPPDILLIQNYLTISKLGLLNTGIAIISVVIFGPTQLLLQQQFFSTLPKEYFQMAEIDGCHDNQVMIHVLIPLCTPIITIISAQTFINVFNDYLWPLLVTNNSSNRTLQVVLTMLDFNETLQYGSLASSVIVASVITVILLLSSKSTMIKHIGRYQILS